MLLQTVLKQEWIINTLNHLLIKSYQQQMYTLNK